MMNSQVQSILFERSKWTYAKAMEWLVKHNYSPLKIDITNNFYRFRIFPPSMFSRFRTKKVSDGIEFVIGF